MAISRGNIFSHFIRIRFLHSSAALSSVPPLPITAATSSSLSFTVDFLVNSCGLSSKSALSVSNKFQLNNKKETPQKGASWLLINNPKILLEQTLDLLMREGVPAHDVKKLLILGPRVMIGMSESTWKKKIEVMKSLGFIEDDILKAFKGFPAFLSYSEENIRKKLNFYFDTMKLEPRNIIVNPRLLGYSIEKRVRPRYHVLKVLESKELIEVTKGMIHLMMISENNFREKYLDEFIDEVPGLLEFYLGIKEGKSSMLEGEQVFVLLE